jgi:glycosyltransferase involved in cell wall biosynthesis
MKNIIFCDQYGQLGGGQQVLLELVKAALANRFAVTVLIPAGSCADKLEALGAEVRRIPSCALTQGKKSVLDLMRFAMHNMLVFFQNFSVLRSADLIYVNGNRLLPVAFLAQRILGKGAACHIHLNHGTLEKKLFRIFLRQRRTVAIVVPSAFIQRELVHFDIAFDSPKVRIVENGLDARFTSTAFEDRFSSHPLRHVGIVGRVSPEKGQDVLPALARRFPDMDFHVMGDAAFSSADFYATLRRDSPANVHFHGWVEDLPQKVREIGLQICLVPSRCPESTPGHSFEAAPLVPMQMAALSCLVMVRRLGALEDVAKNLQLVSFDSDEELIPMIESLKAQPVAEALVLCENSHKLAVSRYGHDSFHENLKGLLCALMSEICKWER